MTLGVLLLSLGGCTPPVVDQPGQGVTLDRAWRVALDYDPLNEPVIEGETFYVAEASGPAAVDLATGTLKWRAPRPQEFQTVGGIYSWGNYLVIPGSLPTGDIQYYADRLGYWTKQGVFLGVETFGNGLVHRWTMAPAGDGPRLFLHASGGFMAYDLNPVFDSTRQRVNASGRSMVVTPPADAGGKPNGWRAGGRPLVDGDLIFVALDPLENAYDPDPPSTPHEYTRLVPARIAALDRTTLAQKWVIDNKYLWPWGGRLAFQKVGENILYADSGGYLLFRPQDGFILWHTLDLGENFVSIDATSHQLFGESLYETTTSNAESAKFYPDEENPSIARLSFRPDLYPGQRSTIEWGLTIPGSESLHGNPVVSNGIVYVLSFNASLVVDAQTGKLFGRDASLVTEQTIAEQTTWKYNDLWLVYTSDRNLTAVKMNLRVGLDGKLYK